MNVTLVMGVYALGAAGLALWLVVRFPTFGPRSVTTALFAGIVAWAGMQVANAAIDPVAQTFRYGVVVVLFLVILPALTAMFWTLTHMLRLLAALRP